MATKVIKKVDRGDDIFCYLSYPNDPYYDLSSILKYGFVQYVCNVEQKEANVIYLFVQEDLRGKGYASQLMEAMIQDVYKQMKNNQVYQFEILLDDTSDQYGQERNIYRKFNFDYCEFDNNSKPSGPEMFLEVRIK